MKLEDRARELLGNIEECSEQFVRTAKQEDEFIVPMIADTLRQVAREERERAARFIETRRECSCGYANNPKRHHKTGCGHAIDCNWYLAAAIRSPEEVSNGSCERQRSNFTRCERFKRKKERARR
jgi:hypothetical protein